MRPTLVPLLAALAGCHAAPPDPSTEPGLRARLGIPPSATTVIVFGQNAHLDVDWQRTFDGYYGAFVGDIFREARGILDQQPRAFYSVAEMAYLEHHLAAHPEDKDALVAHAGRGALRIVGGGITSPDTLLPETELLVRDFLYGARFSEDVLGARAHAAWLPDSFGHSATAPDVLAAAGFASVAFARVDGGVTFFEALAHPKQMPRPGSTAERLAMLGSADFVWNGEGGGSVLAHWMPSSPGLYCMGDNLDYDESFQLAGGHPGVFHDEPAFTDARIDQYVATLRPFAKTPYLFVPVGCDFAHPKPELLAYLDGYDARRYPATGVYAVAAPFEDYAALVDFHRAELPALSGELSPYFMGFYGSRADVKRGVRDAARPFFIAESFATLLGDAGKKIAQSAGAALETLTRADHHDFVTGTANDVVATTEQLPLLAASQTAGEAALAAVEQGLAAHLPAATPGAVARLLVLNGSSASRSEVVDAQVPLGPALAGALHAEAGGTPLPIELVDEQPGCDLGLCAHLRLDMDALPPFAYRAVDLFPGAPAMPVAHDVAGAALLDGNGQPATGDSVARVVLANGHVRATFDRGANGLFALASLLIDGAEQLAGPSFVVRDYADDGGLWRLGNEMLGSCAYAPIAPGAGPDGPAPADAVTLDAAGGLLARVRFSSGGVVREAALGAGESGLQLAVTLAAPIAVTRTVDFAFAAANGAPLRTGAPGGPVERTIERVYDPTYWPAVDFASVGAVAVLLRQSTGARFSENGGLELMAVRNAQQEVCDNEGGHGSDAAPHRIEWRIETVSSAAAAMRAAQAFDRPLVVAPVAPGGSGDLPAEQPLLKLQGDGLITAIKFADRGDGVVVRGLLAPGPLLFCPLSPLPHATAEHLDSSERTLAPIGSLSGWLPLDLPTFGPLATVRLH